VPVRFELRVMEVFWPEHIGGLTVADAAGVALTVMQVCEVHADASE
jgi:hypothetical protein